jgi:hypothetical protein
VYDADSYTPMRYFLLRRDDSPPAMEAWLMQQGACAQVCSGVGAGAAPPPPPGTYKVLFLVVICWSMMCSIGPQAACLRSCPYAFLHMAHT